MKCEKLLQLIGLDKLGSNSGSDINAAKEGPRGFFVKVI